MENMSKRSFADILESRKQQRESLCGRKKIRLKDSVVEITSCHQNAKSLITEVTTGLSQDHGTEYTNLLGNLLQSCVWNETRSDQSSLVIIESCVSKLLHLTKASKKDGVGYKFTKSSMEEVDMTLKLVSQTVDQSSTARQKFISLLVKEQCLPLQYIWKLDIERVIPLESYLHSKHSQSGFVDTLSDLLISEQKYSTTEGDQDVPYIAGVFSKLASFASVNKSETDLIKCKKISMAVIDSVIKKNLDSILSEDKSFHIPDITSICGVDVMKRYCTYVITLVMGYKPDLKVADSLTQQKRWIFAASPPKLTDWFKQLLIPLDGKGVLDLMKLVLDRQEVNWRIVLTFLSTFLVCAPDVTQIIQDYIMEMLQGGLEEPNIENLVIGFLFARQGCYEGAHVFMTYQDWFQNTFGESSKSPANSRKCFTSLVKFLTDMVPFESPHHLKTHILRSPYVPPKCRELYNDYVMLAKTRLADLKHPIDTVNMSDVSTASVSGKAVEQIEDEIQRMLVAFESNKKIPMSVMEASIFRRPYFVGKFLPCLLKPRPLPDVPDLRMKFIEALFRVEKIPQNLYKSYQSACKTEATRLLEGVFMDDEDSISDMDMEPMDQLSHKLDQLLDVILSLPSQKDKVTELVAVIRDKLLTVLDVTVQCDLGNDLLVINAVFPEIPAVQIQAVDHILNFFCKASEHSLASDNPNLIWASQLIQVIGEVRILHKALFVRIWKLVMDQGPELETHHIKGLAAILAVLPLCDNKFQQVEIIFDNCSCSQSNMTFSESIWNSLPIHSEQWMIFSLRLFVDYLQFVFIFYDSSELSTLSELLFTTPLCKKFLYQRSVVHAHTTSDTDSKNCSDSVFRTAHCIASSSKFKVKDMIKLTFEDWVTMELGVHTDEDGLCFETRQQYIYNCVHYTYVNSNSTEGGCNHDYQMACSILLKQIISHDMRDLSAVKFKGCPKCDRNRSYSYHGNRETFVSLLQEMCCFISRNSGTKIPWLQQELSTLVQNASSETERDCLVKTFMRLAVCLPPYLFWTDDIRHTDEDLSISCHVIESLFRNHLCENCFLPCHVTVYLLQGLCQLADHSVTSLLLSKSPLLTLSILIHVAQTAVLLENLSYTEQYKEGDFYQVYQWMEGCKKGNLTTPSLTSSTWMYAGALLSLAINRSCSCDQMKAITSLFRTTDTTSIDMDVLDIYCVLLFVQLAAADVGTRVPITSTNNTEFNEEVLESLILDDKTIFGRIVHYKESDFITKSLPDFICKLIYPRMLRFIKDRLGGQLSSLEDGLDSVVLLFSYTVKEFDMGNFTSKADRYLNMEKYSINYVLDLSDFVKLSIRTASRSALMGIDKNVLKKCGPDILQTFKEALA